ncbi:MAG: lysine--tRNA ligase [Candidatus Dadabacteria bacterium]|nr:lysine--tRNA ligase [Candidatus Dadabacteria bacterium]
MSDKPQETGGGESSEYTLRKRKAGEIRSGGANPYSNTFKPSVLIENVLSADGEKPEKFSIAGRVLSKRSFGKSVFFDVADSSGKIQCYASKSDTSENGFETVQKHLDTGDFAGVEGSVFTTRTGELTVKAEDAALLTKALRPLPEKWHGLKQVETRFRKRYLDLIANPGVKETFVLRSACIRFIRKFLDERGFLEVETPVLHPVAGGAAARPFVTRHNALGMDLFLRVAPELYLKRLVIGGLERVYEIGRVFRNEGVSTRHNPEFTMVEFYQAYADYGDMMAIMEEMLSALVSAVSGGMKISFDGNELDFTPPWKRIDIHDSLREKYGEGILSDDAALFKEADALGVGHDNVRGKAIAGIFEETVAAKLKDPAFVFGFPLDVSPLARASDSRPEIADRFELYVNGWEIANAFSELNDPEEQRKRFEAQAERKREGDDESHDTDEDFLAALEHGMPPTAGAGIGIDRLVMLLTGSTSIREVLFFPHMRPS